MYVRCYNLTSEIYLQVGTKLFLALHKCESTASIAPPQVFFGGAASGNEQQRFLQLSIVSSEMRGYSSKGFVNYELAKNLVRQHLLTVYKQYRLHCRHYFKSCPRLAINLHEGPRAAITGT